MTAGVTVTGMEEDDDEDSWSAGMALLGLVDNGDLVLL